MPPEGSRLPGWGPATDTAYRTGPCTVLNIQASIREHDPIVSGSTVVVFVVQRTACAVVWAGDSRVYRLRTGNLERLTDLRDELERHLASAAAGNHVVHGDWRTAKFVPSTGPAFVMLDPYMNGPVPLAAEAQHRCPRR